MRPIQVHTPFTPDQVDSLNAYQESEYLHPYTCGNPDCPGGTFAESADRLPLAADTDGLHCIEGIGSCGYVQTWAHEWTAGWSWRRQEARAKHQSERAGRKAARQIRRHLRVFGRRR